MKQYTKEHEWIEDTGDGKYRVGITNYAQEQLGDVVSVELPEMATNLIAGDECGVIESVKAASDIYAPVSGEVISVNDDLNDNPALVNEDPEGGGWLWEMTVSDKASLADLMDKAAYDAFCGEQ